MKGRLVRGLSEIRRDYESVEKTWDEHRIEPQEFIDAGDRVVVFLREYQRGKRSGIELTVDTAVGALGARRSRRLLSVACRLLRRSMAVDLVIDVENSPGALAQVAAAISDAGVNIAAATCIGGGERAELHILVPHAEAAKHSLAISHLAVTREREVVVVDVEDRPGVLADLTRQIARAGVNLDLVYVATRNRVVFGAPDLAALRAALADA
jgi:hypothetical protein